MDETMTKEVCEHEWISESEIPTQYAQEVRQICSKCGTLRNTILRLKRSKAPSFQELMEKFHPGEK